VKKYKLFLAAVICLFSAGCWDKVELENRGFIISLGIDKYDDGKRSNQLLEGVQEQNRYTVCAVMPNVMGMRESAASDKSKEVKSADSSTVWGGIQLMDSVSSQKLYLGQTKLLVLGSDLLSDGVLFRQAIDAMERNRDISQKLYLLATRERADGILRLPIPGETMLGLFMVNYYKNNGDSGSISFYKVLAKTMADLHSTGCTLIPEIEKRDPGKQDAQDDKTDVAPDNAAETDEGDGGGEKESLAIKLGGSAVIKDFKLSGWLNGVETRGFEWVMGNCRDTEVTATFNNGYLALKVYGSKPRIDFIRQDGKLKCLVRVKVFGALQEHDFGNSELFSSNEGKLESIYGQVISNEITQTASRLQAEIGADAYNFKDLLRKKDRGLFQAYGGDWERYFRDMEIIPEVKVDIISIGIIK